MDGLITTPADCHSWNVVVTSCDSNELDWLQVARFVLINKSDLCTICHPHSNNTPCSCFVWESSLKDAHSPLCGDRSNHSVCILPSSRLYCWDNEQYVNESKVWAKFYKCACHYCLCLCKRQQLLCPFWLKNIFVQTEQKERGNGEQTMYCLCVCVCVIIKIYITIPFQRFPFIKLAKTYGRALCLL